MSVASSGIKQINGGAIYSQWLAAMIATWTLSAQRQFVSEYQLLEYNSREHLVVGHYVKQNAGLNESSVWSSKVFVTFLEFTARS